MASMRIGIDAFFLNHPLNGVGQVTTHAIDVLIRDAAALGEDCEFFLYLARDCGRAFPAHVHQRVLPLRGARFQLAKKWWEARQLPAAVRRDGCEVLISLYQSAAVMPADFPHVMLVHDIIFALFPQFSDTLGKRLALWLTLRGIRRASHRLADSAHTKADMVKHLGLDAGAITVALIAADPRFASLATPAEVERVLGKHHLTPGYLYHGGGMDPRKNARGVLEAYRLLLDRSSSVPPLVISGRVPSEASPEAPITKWARELNLAEHLVLTGPVPPEDLPGLYRGASVFIYPSRYEGFGLPVLEAMHQGVPVVTANTSSLPEVGGDAALYCDPERPAEIADAIRRLLDEPPLRDALSVRGLARAAQFTWESFIEVLVQAIKATRSRAAAR
jgi:glycosyltransferase involved in cell wall biosynthesis